MGIDININGMTDSSNQLYDGLNHIDIYIEGLKNIPATFCFYKVVKTVLYM